MCGGSSMANRCNCVSIKESSIHSQVKLPWLNKKRRRLRTLKHCLHSFAAKAACHQCIMLFWAHLHFGSAQNAEHNKRNYAYRTELF